MKMAAAREQRDMMSSEDESSPVAGELRRGPWTVEEDLLLVNYIAAHGEGRWNALARCAGLKRTGKSCRLRWLNYLRPDLRRGSMSAQEQLLVLELHARWGNRWSKIAQHLPGRTDNEIKNYWRTRVQKHARQLGCDVNSQRFKDLVRYLWMPRLLERITNSSSSPCSDQVTPPSQQQQLQFSAELSCTAAAASSSSVSTDGKHHHHHQQQQQQPAIGSSCSDNDSNRWQQPAHTATSTEEYCQLVGAAEPCWWSEQVPSGGDLSTSSGSVYYGEMAALPELGETIWGGADDLWYTQLMGL